MGNFTRNLWAAAVVGGIFLVGEPVSAQIFGGDWAKELQYDQPAPRTAGQRRIEKDILGLQAAVRAATIAKDKAQLQKYLMPDYTMTHGGGAVQNRDLRIDFITKGNGGFEAMTPETQTIRVIGNDAAISISNNSVSFRGEKAWVRYMIVYARGSSREGYSGWREQAAHVIAIFNRPPVAPGEVTAPPSPNSAGQ